MLFIPKRNNMDRTCVRLIPIKVPSYDKTAVFPHVIRNTVTGQTSGNAAVLRPITLLGGTEIMTEHNVQNEFAVAFGISHQPGGPS